MTQRYLLTICLFLCSQIAISQKQWAWMAGDKTPDSGPIYGSQGVASASNDPGSRIGACFWTDKNGNLWMFGGRRNNGNQSGFLSDLWTYDISTGMWTWMGGSKTTNTPGTYQTKGEAAAANLPGSRANAACWTQQNGDFWLFGGRGLGSNGDDGNNEDDNGNFLNDLWKYSPSTGLWTFMSGSDRQNQTGNYGVRTEASASNNPGGRYSASAWLDGSGNLWLFGGRGFTSRDEVRLLDDVWKYSPADNSWAWMTGEKSGNEPAHYGDKGIPANKNTPGGRHGCISWTDNNGNFWLYGGGTLADLFADLWKYDRETEQWTWISGSDAHNQQPIYTDQGVADPNYNPGARTLSAIWVDAENNAWIFGGNGYGGGLLGSNPLNNLWKYSHATNEWTFVRGEAGIDPTPVYGSKGVAAASNNPPGTASAAFWNDGKGNFWLFGGRSKEGYLNQVWKLSAACNEQISGTISPAQSTICEGASQVLTATGGTSYEWKVNNEIIAGESGPSITVTQAGTYAVTISNGICHADASNTSSVVVVPKPTGNISPATASLCQNQSVTLTANGGTVYEWRRDGNVITGDSAAIIIVTQPGTYSVSIRNGNCSSEGANTSVVTTGALAGVRYADVEVDANSTIALSARTGGVTYKWTPETGLNDPSSANPTVNVSQGVEYFVTITPENGCAFTDTVRVKVKGNNVANNPKVQVPTAFSPNNNNVNDLLRPLSALAGLSYFRVFNRWGVMVYETKQIGTGWDGRYKGVDQPAETYTWFLSGVLPNGENIKASGKSLLIR